MASELAKRGNTTTPLAKLVTKTTAASNKAQKKVTTPLSAWSPPPLIPRIYKNARKTFFHGREQVDPFSWLENKKNADVKRVLEVENKYVEDFFQLPSTWKQRKEWCSEEESCLESCLSSSANPTSSFHSVPSQSASTQNSLLSSFSSTLRETLFEEMKKRFNDSDVSFPYRLGPFWYYSRHVKHAEYPIFCRCPYDPVKGINVDVSTILSTFLETHDSYEEEDLPVFEDEIVYFDPNLFACEIGVNSLEIGDVKISPDHQKLAVMLDLTDGEEVFTLFILHIQNVSVARWVKEAAPEDVLTACKAVSSTTTEKRYSVYDIIFGKDKKGKGKEKKAKSEASHGILSKEKDNGASSSCVSVPPTSGFFIRCSHHQKGSVAKGRKDSTTPSTSCWIESPPFAAYRKHAAKTSQSKEQMDDRRALKTITRTTKKVEHSKEVRDSALAGISMVNKNTKMRDEKKKKKKVRLVNENECTAGSKKIIAMKKKTNKNSTSVTDTSVSSSFPFSSQDENHSLPLSSTVPTSVAPFLPPHHHVVYRIQQFKMDGEVMWATPTSVLYLGLDDSMRPYQLIHHDLQQKTSAPTTTRSPKGLLSVEKDLKSSKNHPSPSDDSSSTVVCYEEKDEAFWVGSLIHTSDHQYFMFRTSSSECFEWYVSPLQQCRIPIERNNTEKGSSAVHAFPPLSLPTPSSSFAFGASVHCPCGEGESTVYHSTIACEQEGGPPPVVRPLLSSFAQLTGVPVVLDRSPEGYRKEKRSTPTLAPVYKVYPRPESAKAEVESNRKQTKKKPLRSPVVSESCEQIQEKQWTRTQKNEGENPILSPYSSNVEYDVEHHVHLLGPQQGGWLIRANRDGCLNFSVWCVPDSAGVSCSTNPASSSLSQASCSATFSAALPPAFPLTSWIPLLAYDPLTEIESVEATEHLIFFSVRRDGISNTFVCPVSIIWSWWKERTVLLEESHPNSQRECTVDSEKVHREENAPVSNGLENASAGMLPILTSSSSSTDPMHRLLSCDDFLDLSRLIRCYWNKKETEASIGQDGVKEEEEKKKETEKHASKKTNDEKMSGNGIVVNGEVNHFFASSHSTSETSQSLPFEGCNNGPPQKVTNHHQDPSLTTSTSFGASPPAKKSTKKEHLTKSLWRFPEVFSIQEELHMQKDERKLHSSPSFLESASSTAAGALLVNATAGGEATDNKKTEGGEDSSFFSCNEAKTAHPRSGLPAVVQTVKTSPLPLSVEDVSMVDTSFDCRHFRVFLSHLLNPMEVFEMEFLPPAEGMLHSGALSSSSLGEIVVRLLFQEKVKGGYKREDYDGQTIWVPSDYYTGLPSSITSAFTEHPCRGKENSTVSVQPSSPAPTPIVPPTATCTPPIRFSSHLLFSLVPTKEKSPRRDIPVYLVWKKKFYQKGENPLLLNVYGSYGDCCDTDFCSEHLSLLDRGFIWGTAAVRGGGEFGTLWRDEGRKLQRGTTVNDFLSVSSFLQDHSICAHGKLISCAGSAGGLVVCRAMHAAPHLFRAVIGECPFVDCLSSLLRPELPLTVTEWDEFGNPTADPEAYYFLAALSPVNTIPPPFLTCSHCCGGTPGLLRNEKSSKKKTAKGDGSTTASATITTADGSYWDHSEVFHCREFGRSLPSRDNYGSFPHVLLDTSIHDTRVSFWESLKLTARLRERLAALALARQNRKRNEKERKANVSASLPLLEPNVIEETKAKSSESHTTAICLSQPAFTKETKQNPASLTYSFPSSSQPLVLHHCAFDTGHGGATGRFTQLQELAMKFAFALLIVTPFFDLKEEK